MKSSYKEYYREDAEIEVKIIEHITTRLKRVNSFLKMVKKTHPEAINGIIDTLEEKFSHTPVIPQLYDNEFSVLSVYPNLQDKIVNTIWNYMNLPSNILDETQQTSINVKDYLRSYLLILYTLAKSLETIMSHDDAIDYFQAYIDQNTRKERDPTKYLKELADIPTEEFQRMYQSHNFVEFKIHSGKQGTKITKCKWYEVMKDLNEPDISYAVCCYYDFEATKNMNPNFVLTRKKTIMQGDDYCDFCDHDIRIEHAVEHPPEVFWKTLE